MPDYRPIDWQEDPPSGEALAGALGRSRVVELPTLEQDLARIVDNCNAWPNGHAAAAQFVLDLDPALAFYVTRNRLHETLFFADFFRHPAVRARLLGEEQLTWHEGAPEDSYAAHVGPTLGFEFISSWETIARLASRLSHGGVYDCGGGLPDGKIIELTAGVAAAAFDSRYSGTLSYYSWKPWASWFYASHEDSSWLWIDKRTGVATVLMITDAH